VAFLLLHFAQILSVSKEYLMRLLINLPPTFFTHPQLKPQFDRLHALASEVRHTSHNMTSEIMADLPWAEAVVMWAWPGFGETELASCPNLKFLGQINTTQKHVKACLAKGVAISEARHSWSPAVAEMALTLILAGLRRTSTFHMQMREGSEPWVSNFPADIDPLERQLTGLAVGVVGFGGIGQRLAQLLAPFNVTLRIYDPFLPAAVADSFGANQVSVKELVGQSDVVVLCAANNEGARHLLGAEEIAALRPNAVLVNVGRSMLVDMPALQARLEKTPTLTAMLDVFDTEPLEADHPLRKLSNAFLTPHRAGGIMASVERALDWLANDLEAYQQGRALKYAVTERMLPSFPEG
jgi:phosphoglycerate dehydrogenase-like enzyme